MDWPPVVYGVLPLGPRRRDEHQNSRDAAYVG